MKKVTVLMPVYNGGPQLSASIDSVLEQSFTDFELLVVDDGSTDGTAEYLASIDDPRLRVISVPHCGLSAALQLGLCRAVGEYIARQDADDVAHRTRLEVQVAFLDANPHVVLVGGCAIAHDGAGTCLGVIGHPTSPAALRWRLLFDNGVIHSTAVFRRREALDAGGYTCDGAEDYDLWSRLARRHDVANIGSTLIAYQLAETGIHATSGPAIDAHALSISTANIAALLEGTRWADQASNVARLHRVDNRPAPAELIPAVEGLLLLQDVFLGTSKVIPGAMSRPGTGSTDRDYVCRYTWRLIAVTALLAAAPTQLGVVGRLVWLSRRTGAGIQLTMLLAGTVFPAAAVGSRRTNTVRRLASHLLLSNPGRRERLPIVSASDSSAFGRTVQAMGVTAAGRSRPRSLRWRRSRAGAAAAAP
jgi:glycosyltransferase involved in cell wall biosynthesis